jgi:phage shock protein PspC (stress-responsive transcriptional regulator)
MTRPRRFLFGTVLSLGLAGCGFTLAGYIAGRCCVPPGSGLAGPAIVVGWAALGALAALVAGIVLAVWLPPTGLRIAAVVAGLAGLLVYGSLGYALLVSRVETRAQLEEAYTRLPAFRVVLTAGPGAPAAFERFSADWSRRRFSAEKAGGACEGTLSGEQAVELLTALRAAEGVLYRTPDACADRGGPIHHVLRATIPSPLPPDTEIDQGLTGSCLSAYPDLAAPFAAAARLAQEARCDFRAPGASRDPR